jgi:hypothetical protein
VAISLDPDSDMTRKLILTKPVLASIPELVASGLSRDEIAERLGCKLSTLNVRCCQERIRLPSSRRGRPRKLPATKTKRITISTDALALFDSTADAKGMTANALVSRLLELIVRDNLINAILDEVACPTLSRVPSARLAASAGRTSGRIFTGTGLFLQGAENN